MLTKVQEPYDTEPTTVSNSWLIERTKNYTSATSGRDNWYQSRDLVSKSVTRKHHWCKSDNKQSEQSRKDDI